MKTDKLQMPDICNSIPIQALDLRTLMQIYQRGGRITRSTRAPNKPNNPKPKEKAKTLTSYLGDPCLMKYLQGTNIKYRQSISNQYFINKNMRRLNKQHLPQNCLYYEKNNQISELPSYRLRFVKLNAKKPKATEYLIQEINRPNFTAKSLNIQNDVGVLTVTQSLVLYLINFQQFQKVFQHILIEIKENYRNMKIQELSKIQEQRQNIFIQNQEKQVNQSQMKPEPQEQLNPRQYQQNMVEQNKNFINPQPQQQPLPSLFKPQPEHQFLPQIQPQAQNQPSPKPQQIFQIINKEISQLTENLFKKLSLPKMKGILWPCVVLQPLVGEKDQLQVMIMKKLDQSSKDQYRSSKIETKYDQKVLYNAYEEYLDQTASDTVDKQKENHNFERFINKCESIFNKLECSKQSKLFINLLGTHQTKVIYNNFIKWQDCQTDQIQQIIMKSPLRGLIDDLNSHIECLNKFKKLQNSIVDNKYSLFRLCKYQNEKGETDICLPLRNQQTKDERKVLVRFLRDEHPINHQEKLLKWVEHSKISVNFTLPRHSQIQKKFYYILGNNISIQQGINYIYSDFYYKSCNFNEVMRLCYPQNDLRKVKVKEQRCISCYYQVHNLSYFRCKYCLRFCHQQCTQFKSKPHSQAETAGVPFDIHSTDNDEELWNCSQCAPCVECQMAVKDSFIQCFSCKNVYHPICGKLKGLSDQDIQQDKYTCQNCLKCRMCNVKLKYQEYCIVAKNILCVKCYKDYNNNEYCALCVKEATGDWVQCDQRPCEKWIHMSCDSYFKSKNIAQPIEKLNYSCPNCRKLQKRKIFRNIIEQLKYFDQFQYFYQPDYEQLIGYKQTIKNPICIHEMRQKSLQGAYDTNSYELIKADLQLIVRNAMNFNMPKDEAHYRAKILLVVGTKYLQFFRDMIQCDEEFLVNNSIEQIYFAKKKQFYNDLYQHYLEYLFNFRSERSIVQVKKINFSQYQQEFFSSKIILSRIYSNAEFIFKIKQKPHTIQNLFTIPRLSTAAWWPLRVKTCYYHPDQENPIIFECNVCWQKYCCVKACLNHHVCKNCGQKGCGCDNFRCQCPIMKQKQKKIFQAKIHSTLSQSKLEKRQYTEYYKYCLKCVSQNLKTNWCYICLNFCYYAYERCSECNKVYHLNCQQKNKWQDMSLFFENKETYKNSYHNVRLSHMCYSCSYSPKYSQSAKEKLITQTKATASKIITISKYLPIFNYIYQLYGIRLAPNEIINLLNHNYQSFLEKEPYFKEFLINFPVVIESIGNNKISREQFREYFMNEITRKLSGQNLHEKIISIVETKPIKQLKQSKKFLKIYSKWFTNFYYPYNFINSYEIKYHLEHLISKINHYSGLNIGYNLIYQHMLTDHHHNFAANFRQENHLNSRNFQRLKIESITTHVSPKSKRNIYFTNKKEKCKLYNIFLLNYNNYKNTKISILNEKMSDQQNSQLNFFTSVAKQYQKYLRFHADYQSITDCIYKQENSKSLLSQYSHLKYFNPFEENSGLVKYNKISAFREHENTYINNKSQMLYKYLSHFALKIFEENKIVLKKGNTSILSQSKKCWKILKTINDEDVQIKLQKRDERWILNINDSVYIVKSIQDIILRLKEIFPIAHSFEDIVQIMGFGMTDNTFYEPNHFTHLLQTLPLDSLNRRDRKRQVIKVYDRYQWQRQGNFTLHTVIDNNPTKFEYNVTKKDLFYLKKRNTNSQQANIQPKVIPFITFQDIKKDLQQPNTTVKQKQHLINKQPTYDVYIAPSKIDRLGLFIRNYTKKNTVVTEYIGEVISQAMADIRQQKFHFGCYMFSLGKNNTRLEIIDATFIGNMSRYLNHSCDPNCKAKIQLLNGQPRILIYTIKDVKQNEELTYDYQFKVDGNQRLTCKCKSKNCQGRLT